MMDGLILWALRHLGYHRGRELDGRHHAVMHAYVCMCEYVILLALLFSRPVLGGRHQVERREPRDICPIVAEND